MSESNNKSNKELDEETIKINAIRDQNMYLLLIVSYLFIFTFTFTFHNYFKIPNEFIKPSIVFTLLMPLVFITYSTFYHTNYEPNRKTEDDFKELENENKSEEAPKLIPVVLFGLGIIMTKLKIKYSTVLPFLLCSLLFGTILTEMVNQLIFDNLNLERMLIAEEIKFVLIMLAYGYMIMSIYLVLNSFK